MLAKITKDRVLNKKMKLKIHGGATCWNQCNMDCFYDDQVLYAVNGDAAPKAGDIEQPL
jgi:hypothetical protein